MSCHVPATQDVLEEIYGTDGLEDQLHPKFSETILTRFRVSQVSREISSFFFFLILLFFFRFDSRIRPGLNTREMTGIESCLGGS